MKARTLLLTVLPAVVAAACGGGSGAEAEPLVMVTTTILGDIVRNAAGDDARVEVLMPLGADPHAYEASARQAARLREADLIVANGVGLEEGLLGVIEEAEADGVPVLYVGDLLDPRPYVGPGVQHWGEEAHEHEGGLDPHVWMDPVRMQRAVDLIAERLSGLAEGDFLDRAAGYRAQLGELSAYIEGRISTVPAENRKLVTNHFAYGYYAERYRLEMLGTVIPAATTEAETSAAQFAQLVELIDREDVAVIFASTTEPIRLAEAIAAEVGRDVAVIELYTGSLGEEGSGAETYIGMMRTSTDRIVEALGG